MKITDIEKMVETQASSGSSGEKTAFMKLKEGVNTVRFISEMESESETYYSAKLKRTVFDRELATPDENGKISKKVTSWVYVIDREDSAVKLLQFPISILKAILETQKDPDFSFENIPNYDFKITSKKESSKTTYTVLPGKEKDLTAEEAALALTLPDLRAKIDDMKDYTRKQIQQPNSDAALAALGIAKLTS